MEKFNVAFTGWPAWIRVVDPKAMSTEERDAVHLLFLDGTIKMRRLTARERVENEAVRRKESLLCNMRQSRSDAGKKRIRTNPATRKKNLRYPREKFLSPETIPDAWDKWKPRYAVEVVLPLRRMPIPNLYRSNE